MAIPWMFAERMRMSRIVNKIATRVSRFINPHLSFLSHPRCDTDPSELLAPDTASIARLPLPESRQAGSGIAVPAVSDWSPLAWLPNRAEAGGRQLDPAGFAAIPGHQPGVNRGNSGVGDFCWGRFEAASLMKDSFVNLGFANWLR